MLRPFDQRLNTVFVSLLFFHICDIKLISLKVVYNAYFIELIFVIRG